MQIEQQDLQHRRIVTGLLESYRRHGQMSHLEGCYVPSREVIWGVVEDLLRVLFPGFLESVQVSPDELADHTADRLESIERRLAGEIERGLCLEQGKADSTGEIRQKAEKATLALLKEIPALRDLLAIDVEAAFEGDPAARSNEIIIIAYPGLQAIAVYRLAHVLYQEGIRLVARVMTEYAHSRTGIDIHPGARIGRHFFIDHGTGVVIGETTVIGDNVKVYQGVTLGARSFPKDAAGRVLKGHKRHPNIEDDVTIYSGATILGDVTIGKRSIIGGNVWLTHDIPPSSKIMVRPPQQIHIENDALDFQI